MVKVFTPIISNDLAYVLGVCKGDGWVGKSRDGKYYKYIIQLSVVSRTFATSFRDVLKRLGFHTMMFKTKPGKPNHSPQHRVVVMCKSFVEWYSKLTSQNISDIVLHDDDTSKEFLKGFYESEGSITNNGSNAWRIIIYNTKRELQTIVTECLTKLGIQFKIYGPYSSDGKSGKRHRPIWHIVIVKDDVGKFFSLVSPCIKNKYPKRVPDEERRKRTGKMMKKLWSKPDFREKMIIAFKKRYHPKKKLKTSYKPLTEGTTYEEVYGTDMAQRRKMTQSRIMKNLISSGRMKKPVHYTWSSEQIDTLKRLYPAMKNEEIGGIINKSGKAVVLKAIRLGLKKIVRIKPSHEWTDEQVSILRELFGKVSNEEIAIKVNRTVDGVQMKAFLLGLRKGFHPPPKDAWTQNEIDTLVRMYAEHKSPDEICKVLNRNRHAVHTKAYRLGITKKRAKI